MHYVETYDRNQMMMKTWNSLIEPDSTASPIDVFVDSLNLADYGIKRWHRKGEYHMISGDCINYIFMVAITESDLQKV